MALNLEMPRATTPPRVFVILAGIALLGGGALYALLGFWGVILLFAILGTTTGVYTKPVDGYHALIVLDQWSGVQRTLFQGLNFALPWESNTQEVDLRVDLKEVREETYASTDALMETRYVYTIRPDFSGTDGGKKIVLYASYEADAIRGSGRALFSMLLSDYFGKHSGQDLLEKNLINRETFERDPGRSLIDEFERSHGVKVTVRLEYCGFNQRTQRVRDMVSGAKSFDQAVETSLENHKSRAQSPLICVTSISWKLNNTTLRRRLVGEY